MIRIFEVTVDRYNNITFKIGRKYKAVQAEGLMTFKSGKRLVYRPARRCIETIAYFPALWEHRGIDLTRTPHITGYRRECFFCSREALVKVSAGYHIIALCVFLFDKVNHYLSLLGLGLIIIVGFDPRIYSKSF